MPDFPLYPTEAQIARKVLGPNRLDEWKGLVQILERDGFPKVDPLFGGRYMPAVCTWLDVYNRIAKITPPRSGRETWPEPKRQGSNGANVKPENVFPIGTRDPT